MSDRPTSEPVERGAGAPSCLFVLTYYAPYVSGLTQIAVQTAETLVRRGWRVTAVCTNHASLPAIEVVGGVRVRRARPLVSVSKGVISPGFLRLVRSEAREHDSVVVVAPLAEAMLLPVLIRRPYLFLYVCDVVADASVPAWVVRGLDLSHRVGLRFASRRGVLSRDYADCSRLRAHLADALELPPPCTDRSAGIPAFREGEGLHVGFLGRIVSEKGVDRLVRAFLSRAGVDDRLLIAGDYTEVAGGSVIGQVLEAARGDGRVRLLGRLPDVRLADFLASLDVLALPSLNSFEAFGIVQVEALSAGCRVVASDLPGVRVPLLTCGGGTLVPPGDVAALADALWARPALRPTGRDPIALFGVEACTDRFERAFTELEHRRADSAHIRPSGPAWTSSGSDYRFEQEDRAGHLDHEAELRPAGPCTGRLEADARERGDER